MHTVLGLVEDLGGTGLEDLVRDLHLGDAELLGNLGTLLGVGVIGDLDRDIGQRVSSGASLAEAQAPYLGDAAFNAWYNDTLSKLEALI